MARLNKSIRAAILDAALEKSQFPARIRKLEQQRNDWMFDLLVKGMGGTQKYIERLQEIKAVNQKLKWLGKHTAGINYSARNCTAASSWYINFNGARFTSHQIKYPEGFVEQHRDVLTNNSLDRVLFPSEGVISFTGDSKEVAKFYDFERQINELSSSKKTIEANVKALLQSVGTTKSLLKIWPECEELIPKVDEAVILRQQTAKQLPAINMQSLNAAIGIPSPEKS